MLSQTQDLMKQKSKLLTANHNQAHLHINSDSNLPAISKARVEDKPIKKSAQYVLIEQEKEAAVIEKFKESQKDELDAVPVTHQVIEEWLNKVLKQSENEDLRKQNEHGGDPRNFKSPSQIYGVDI